MMCLPVSGTIEHISAPRCFFCASGNQVVHPQPTTVELSILREFHNQQLWNSQFSESSTAVEVAQFLKGVCCLFLQLGPISFCMDQRSQEFDVSHLNVQMRWVLHVGHYPSLLYRHLCISMCSEKKHL